MPHKSMTAIIPDLEALASDESLTPEFRISRLVEYSNNFIMKVVNLSMVTSRMASQLGAMLTKLDTSKKLSRNDGAVVGARQLMHVYNKQRGELYLVPDVADEPDYALGLVKILLLAMPQRKDDPGFMERVAAIRAINELITAVAEQGEDDGDNSGA